MLREEPLDLEVWVRIPAMENSSRTGICFKICNVVRKDQKLVN